MDLSLNGRRALVCGATQGIGKAVAMELAAAGAEVTVLARDAAKLAGLLSELPTNDNQKHAWIAADMADPGALAGSLATHRDHLVRIDIVINNTGGPPPGKAHEAPIEAFEAAFRLHLLAFQSLVLAVVPGMKERRSGRIINIISTSVKQPLPDLGVSNTVRGAVANWSKTLANELGPFGITVNNVLPGATSTERLQAIIERKARSKGITLQEAADEMAGEVPLKRFARPEEVAYAAAFLASDAAAYINGINLPVDGGRTASL